MAEKRLIEIFSAGCSICDQTIRMANELVCDSCEIVVLEMNDEDVADRAEKLAIRSVPAVLANGELASCCAGRGPDKAALATAGVGNPIAWIKHISSAPQRTKEHRP